MTYTDAPVKCPHCGTDIDRFESILTHNRLGGDLTVIACASCEKVLGLVPKKD
jgi:phage FluMu protein Com